MEKDVKADAEAEIAIKTRYLSMNECRLQAHKAKVLGRPLMKSFNEVIPHHPIEAMNRGGYGCARFRAEKLYRKRGKAIERV